MLTYPFDAIRQWQAGAADDLAALVSASIQPT
jgi:hypothetical protein